MEKIQVNLTISQELEINKETILKYEKDGVNYILTLKIETAIAHNIKKLTKKAEEEEEEKEKGRTKRTLRKTPSSGIKK